MNVYLLIPILLFSKALISQNCENNLISENNISEFESFLMDSPIHIPANPSTYKIDKSNSSYFPEEDYIPWGGWYMPFVYGGIANRYLECKTCYPDTNSLLTWDEIDTLTIDDVAKLSPAEKMDIYMGNNQMWFTFNELMHRGPHKVGVQGWEGFCNGMRAAGALLPEPIDTIVVKSKRTPGRYYVKFYPRDLKALAAASYYYGQFDFDIGENGKCPPNPGLFDIALRECLGKQKRTFFIDVDTTEQKWNESIVGYERTITQNVSIHSIQDAPQNAVAGVSITTTLYVLGEMPLSDESTIPKIKNKDNLDKWVAQYILFIDKEDNIIGGMWERFYNTDQEYPEQNYRNSDYIWFLSGEGTDWIEWDSVDSAYYHFWDIANLIYMSIK